MTRRPAVFAAITFFLTAAVGLLPPPATGLGAEDQVSFEEVRPGIWAALQPEALRFTDSNSVVIFSGQDVIVIDSQASPESSRNLIARIRAHSDKPVRYLVNTHFHSDHTRGNFVYRDLFPRVDIIGHATLRADIPARAAPDLESELDLYRREIPTGEDRLAKGVNRGGEALDDAGSSLLASQIDGARKTLFELESIRWELPSLTVNDSLTFQRSVGPIQIRSVHAHTRGDLVVYLPEARVLVAGDVLDDLPFGGHGYPGDWIEVLNELERLEWNVLIPGHGRIRHGDEARAHLSTVRALFELMLSWAHKAAASDLDLETARSSLLESEDLAPFRASLAGDDSVAGRAFDNFVPAGFERAYLEVTDQLTD